MKPWPLEGSVNFCDLVEPLARILRENVTLSLTYTPSTYEGYDIGEREKACSPTPDQDLSPEWLEYHKDHGRDLIDVILANAVRLGIEQGRRLEREHEKINKLIETVLG
jgi:hypothetical protein